jgi:hypothetical protein
MSASSVQAHQFYKDVAKNREVWTVRKGDVFAKLTLGDGRITTPFWSTRSRVERVIKSIPVYAGSEPVRIPFDEFIRDWIPPIQQEGGLLGINWSGASLRGFNLDAEFVLRAIQSYEADAS